MSVVPQEDKLVMSFQEATRVFHSGADQPLGPAVGGGPFEDVDSTRTAVAPPQTAPPFNRGATTRSGVQYFDAPTAPVVGPGHAGVVPADTQPTSHDIATHPEALVEIRNPNYDQQIDEDDEYYSNPWFSARSWMRVYFAEFLGTMILVLWGEGTQAQVVAARQQPNDYLSVAWGWGVGFMLAIYVSSGISGGHINPAVTIALAIFRGFSWKKVPGYILAQLLGAFTAAAVIFGVYYGPLHAIPTGYAGVMTTGPSALLPSVASTFFSVFTGAALLMGSIAAFTDTGNNPATPGLTPLLLGLIMVGIASSFGYQTGFVLNPARDLGPRLLVWATGGGGRGGRALWLDNSAYGIWAPTAGTIAGASFGILLYDLLIYQGRDSPVNFNFSRRNRRQRGRRTALDVESSSAATLPGARDSHVPKVKQG